MNDQALQALSRAIRLGKGEFSLIIIVSNYQKPHQYIMQNLKTSIGVNEIIIPSCAESIYEYIKSSLTNKKTSALIVFGLESVNDKGLKSLQQDRELYNKLSCPIILWLNDSILLKLVRLAPDFRSWASTPINFEINN